MNLLTVAGITIAICILSVRGAVRVGFCIEQIFIGREIKERNRIRLYADDSEED